VIWTTTTNSVWTGPVWTGPHVTLTAVSSDFLLAHQVYLLCTCWSLPQPEDSQCVYCQRHGGWTPT
jgi:hypothetical protein